MVTFKPVVFHQSKPKDGAYNVKIRVTYKGVSRFLPTTLYCTGSDLTRQGKIKQGNILARGNALCDEMRGTLSDVSPFTLIDKDVDWVVNHIKTTLSTDRFHLDFFDFAYEHIKDKPAGTRMGYVSSLRSFAEFTGGSIDINDITASMLKEFMAWVNKSPIRHKGVVIPGTTHLQGCGERKAGYLRHIYRSAQDRYNDEDSGKIAIPKSPFSKISYKTPPPSFGQKSVGADVIQMLIDAEPTGRRERNAIDYFLISFALMGANEIDLYEALPPKNGIYEYNRAKTRDRRADHSYMRVYVPDEIQPYIERHRDPTGRRWLDMYTQYNSMNYIYQTMSIGLAQFCEHNGISPAFKFYAARKTWATLARKQKGIDKATIDEGLAHVGLLRVADIYIEKDWDIINEANRKVISQFKWR